MLNTYAPKNRTLKFHETNIDSSKEETDISTFTCGLVALFALKNSSLIINRSCKKIVRI